MKIIIRTPIWAEIVEITEKEKKDLKNELTYTNTSISYQISKFKQQKWLKNKNPRAYEARLAELKAEQKKTLVWEQNGKLFIRPASIPYLQGSVEVTNLINYPEFKPLKLVKPIPFKPHDYQRQSVDKLKTIKHGNVEIATGGGKSLILLLLSQEIGLDTLVITPSQAIFSEIYELFTEHLGENLVGRFGDGKKDIKKKITVAIGDSISRIKEGTPEWEFISKKQVLIGDESHVFGAKELDVVCNGILQNIPYRLLLSATQTRGDGTEILLNSIIGKTVHSLPIDEAIQKGYLCRLKFKVFKTFSPCTIKTDDPLEAKRLHFLNNQKIAELSAKIANVMWEQKKESTLILVDELDQIAKVTKLLKVPFAYAHSASKKDAEIAGLVKVDTQQSVEDFNKGKVRVLLGTNCINTGVNIYPTHHVINWKGGTSEIVTKQGAIGRSTRKLENSKYKDLHTPKPFTTIYDFNVIEQPILERHLQNRISFYEETGCEIQKIDL